MQQRVAFYKRPHLLITALTFTVYAAYSCSRYYQFRTSGYDLGIFDQVVRRYSHFQAPMIGLKGVGYNIYGDHFHPILATLAPLYWIWPDPRMLLLAQAALIALSVWIVHRYCARHLTQRVALAATAAYALGWPLQAMANFDFHEVAFAVPIVAWAIDALDRRRGRELVAACLLLLLVREDMGLIVAILCAVAAWRWRSKRWLILTGVGLIGYYVATSVVLPHFNPSGKFAYWTYDSLGPDLPSAIKHLITHPWDGVKLFFSPVEKTATLFWLFLPVLFLALRSPYTWCLLPILAERFFSSREFLWGMRFHYSSFLWPILLMAAIDAARKRGYLANQQLVRRAVAFAVLVPLVGTLSWGRIWPLERAVTGKAFQSKYFARSAEPIVERIPHSTCVMVEDHLASHLTRWNKVSLPTTDLTGIDFVAIDYIAQNIGYLMPASGVMYYAAIDQGFTAIAESGHFILLRRDSYTGPSKACSPYAKS